ncbi:MAG: hypothetical protein HQM10_04080 [Candidatus Riflebacteria bacterium]|nr:hypothetical protein [Candidatus Riflebacteria bacterium]
MKKLLIILIIFFTLLTLIAPLYLSGKQKQINYLKGFNDGVSFFSSEKYDQAIESFEKALAYDSTSRRFFSRISQDASSDAAANPDPDTIRLLLCETLLAKAYDELFRIKPAEIYLDKAGKVLAAANSSESAILKTNIATAYNVSKLCKTAKKGEFDKVLKELLDVEKKALPTDRDFLIMEIRLLIICGKALKNPNLLREARELLWIVTSRSEAPDKRVDQLWPLLHR